MSRSKVVKYDAFCIRADVARCNQKIWCGLGAIKMKVSGWICVTFINNQQNFIQHSFAKANFMCRSTYRRQCAFQLNGSTTVMLAQDRGRWRTLVNAVMNLRVP